MRPEFSSTTIQRIMGSVNIGTLIDGRVGPPHEKCGLLRGRGHQITAADETRNVSSTPQSAFEIDPVQLLAAYKAQRRPNALQILGFYHTHLTDDPTPSVRDAESAAPDGMLWLIATRLQARLWRAVPNGSVHGRFDAVRFDMKQGKRVHCDLLEARHIDYGRLETYRIDRYD